MQRFFILLFFFTNNYVADMTEEKKDRNFFTLISSFLKSSLKTKKKERKGKPCTVLFQALHWEVKIFNQGHPTTLLCKITVPRRKYCLEIS